MTETSESASWAPGSVVGAYTLLAKLATGGMAEIWLARQSGLRGFERLVVVKRIIESLSSDEAFVEMFLDEARIVVQLTHPNIVQVFDLGEHAGAYYLAMEYLAGENLVGVVRAAAKAGTPLTAEASVKFAIAALDGLEHAHTRTGLDGQPLNVVHRDVSPQNLIVTWDGQVKLVDFGIARAANRATHTQKDQLKGKFAYMAPEQADGAPDLDRRVDVFAMGVVLWELVTHKRLFGQDDAVRILKSLIGPDRIETAKARNPEVPQALSDIIARALEKNRDARYQSAHEFKAALEEWLRSVGGGPTTAELGQLMQRLFKARIAERAQLIERAAKGEVSQTKAAEVMKPPTDSSSMPGATPSQKVMRPVEVPSRATDPVSRPAGPLVRQTDPSVRATEAHETRVAPSDTHVAPADTVAQAPRGADETSETVAQLQPVASSRLIGFAVAATVVLVLMAAALTWKVWFNEPSVVPPVEPPPVVEPIAKPTPTPEPVKVVPATVERASTLAVETEPAGATVMVDGKEVGVAPLTVPELAAGEHVVEATLNGYLNVKRTVTASAEGDKLMVMLTLPQKKVEAARGKLTLNTEPWTHVSLNGKPLGDTPLVEVPLPAGRHRLQLTNEQAKIDLAVEVEVKAGQLTKKSLRL